MPRIIISTTNDISTDNRVNKIALLLLDLGYDVLWIGRKLNSSLPLERTYKTHRMKLWFTAGALFYAEFNLRLFFFLLFRKSDVLLSNDLDTLLANYLASRLKRKELVYDTHEYFLGVPEIQDNPLAKKVWTKIERWIFPKLKTVFTVNNSIAELYLHDYFGLKPKVFRNISPVNLPKRIKTRAELGLPENKYLVINQGSGMNVDRGIEEALEAVLRIEHAVLLLVGSGDVIPQLKVEVKKRGVEDKVIFIGRVPYAELLQYTANADVGISLDKDTNINYKYSLPNKLFDYIHCSIPVVCSKVIEVKRIVEHYKIGVFVDPENIEELAHAIETILKLGKDYFKDKLEVASKAENWEFEKKIPADVYTEIKKKLAPSIKQEPEVKPKQKSNNDIQLLHPQLPSLLKERAFEQNLDVDFDGTTGRELVMLLDDYNRNLPHLFDGLERVPISIESDVHLAPLTEGTPFQIFRTSATSQKSSVAVWGVLKDGKELIPPYFYYVFFFKEQNVFACTSYPLDGSNPDGYGYEIYYFDTKGRYIDLRVGRSLVKLPGFVFLKQENKVEVVGPFPEGISIDHWDDILGQDYFIVCKWPLKGLANRWGKVLVEPAYEDVWVSPKFDWLIGTKEWEPLSFVSVASGEVRKIEGASVLECKGDYVVVKMDDDKVGVARFNAEWVIEPAFGNVMLCENPDRFIVYKGKYSTGYKQKDDEYFDEYLSPRSFNGDYLETVQKKLRWGMVKKDLTQVLPFKYTWIDVFEKGFLANTGGEVFRYYDGDAKEDRIAIVGGEWNLMNLKGELQKSFVPMDFFKVLMEELNVAESDKKLVRPYIVREKQVD